LHEKPIKIGAKVVGNGQGYGIPSLIVRSRAPPEAV
jgi:hypothetical protein